MYGYLLATLNNSSEMGTIANIEQQSMLRTRLLEQHDKKLEEMLGKSLPSEVHLRKDYQGPVRIVVPAKRSICHLNEDLGLKVIIPGNKRVKTAKLFYRTMGDPGKFQQRPLTHQAKAVYTVTLPQSKNDIEYYIKVITLDDTSIIWPATALEINQTVVVMPE